MLVAASSSGAVEADPPSKKTKKSAAKTAKLPTETKAKTATKDKKVADATNGTTSKPVKLDTAPARDIKPRKRAADFLSDDEDEVVKTDKKNASKGSKSETVKPAKKKAKEDAKTTSVVPKAGKDAVKETKVETKKESSKKSTKEPEAPAFRDEESGDEDDQTLALIRGFESSGEEDISGDEGFEPGQDVPQIPDSKQVKRKLRKLKKSHSDEPEKPGTVYIG